MVLTVLAMLAAAAPDARAQFIRAPFAPPVPAEPRQEPPTLTPTFTVTEEFNDNVFLDNRMRRSDFVTGLSPGLDFATETARYRLAARYRFTAEFFARHEDLNNTDRHDFSLESFYRLSPRLTLALGDQFSSGPDTPQVSVDGIATGRELSFHNSVVGTLTWAADDRTGLRLVGVHTLQRFESSASKDSNVYRGQLTVDRVLAKPLTGTAGYEFAAFDIEDERPTYTHTPRLGARYRFTESLEGRLGAGPTFAVREADTRVTPAVTASLEQQFSWGAVTVLYDRAVGTAGGLGGTTENQIFSARLEVTSLVPDLVVELGPRYLIVDSATNRRLDVRVLSVALQATYKVSSWLTAVLSYGWLRQRTETDIGAAGETIATDVDQNRVYFALQVGYPIRKK
jgi:hypothetical protein